MLLFFFFKKSKKKNINQYEMLQSLKIDEGFITNQNWQDLKKKIE